MGNKIAKVASAVIIAISVLLLVIGMVLFSNDKGKAGFWLVGAGVVFGGYSFWLYKYLSKE